MGCWWKLQHFTGKTEIVRNDAALLTWSASRTIAMEHVALVDGLTPLKTQSLGRGSTSLAGSNRHVAIRRHSFGCPPPASLSWAQIRR